MSKRWAVALVGMMLLATLACGPLGNVGNLVGGQAGAASSLWADVPAYPGATKVDIELPAPIRLAAGVALQALRSQAVGADVQNMEFIAYSTPDSAEQIQAFYTNKRMADEGWTAADSPGCGAAEAGTDSFGAMCVFARETDTQASALFVIATPGDNGESIIFYTRVDGEPAK